MTDLHAYLLGVVSTLSVVAALFFIRYWRVSRDRFFLLFAIAFSLMAINWASVAITAPASESRHWAYVLRLVAFLLILAAIVDKNRTPPR
jgi:hypothetical protein